MARSTVESADYLRRLTYDTAEYYFNTGCISQDEWEGYCHAWRNSTFRYSVLAEGYETNPLESGNALDIGTAILERISSDGC